MFRTLRRKIKSKYAYKVHKDERFHVIFTNEIGISIRVAPSLGHDLKGKFGKTAVTPVQWFLILTSAIVQTPFLEWSSTTLSG